MRLLIGWNGFFRIRFYVLRKVILSLWVVSVLVKVWLCYSVFCRALKRMYKNGAATSLATFVVIDDENVAYVFS